MRARSDISGRERTGFGKLLLWLAVASVLALTLGTSLVVGRASAAPSVATSGYAPMTSALAAQLSKNVNQHVIVVMKTQFAAAPEGSQAARTRSATVTGVPGTDF
jgi:hypothetical protein